jgi:hypothetical protein
MPSVFLAFHLGINQPSFMKCERNFMPLQLADLRNCDVNETQSPLNGRP